MLKKFKKLHIFIEYIRIYIDKGGLYGCLGIDTNREKYSDHKIVEKKIVDFSKFFRPYIPFEILLKITI